MLHGNRRNICQRFTNQPANLIECGLHYTLNIIHLMLVGLIYKPVGAILVALFDILGLEN